MNPPHDRERDLERLLGEGGGELGALYRRLRRVEPPRRLDRVVLGEAARAVRGRPPRRQRWLIGFGSAAGIVLAAGIAWRVGQEASQQRPGAAAPQVIQVQPITESAPRRHERAADAARQSVAPPPAAMRAEPVAPPPPAVVAPPPARKAAPKAQSPARPAQTAPVAAPAPFPEAAAPPPPPAPMSPPLAAPAPAASAPLSSAAANAAEDKIANGAAEAESHAAAAPLERKRSSAPTAPSTSAELRRDMQLAPADWLAHIRQLLHQGRRQQAAESLRLFRRAHPDWTLPPELDALSD